MTRKDTEDFLECYPNLFRNFSSKREFCLPYGQGWIDILHECCSKLEYINNKLHRPTVTFTKADYKIEKDTNNKYIECGKILFSVKVENNISDDLKNKIIDIKNELETRTYNTCEICGEDISKNRNMLYNGDVIGVKRYKVMCDKCYHDLRNDESFCGYSSNDVRDDSIVFDIDSRKIFVRNILCDLKSYILYRNENVDIDFYENKNPSNVGFGFTFIVSPKNKNFGKDDYYILKNFVSNMLDYLFNDDLSFDIFEDYHNSSFGVEIESKF